MAKEFVTEHYRNNPDLEVLNPEGCRILLQVGEKALAKLMSEGLPYLPVSNSYRFVRHQVIQWVEDQAARTVQQALDLSSTKTGRSASAGGSGTKKEK